MHLFLGTEYVICFLNLEFSMHTRFLFFFSEINILSYKEFDKNRDFSMLLIKIFLFFLNVKKRVNKSFAYCTLYCTLYCTMLKMIVKTENAPTNFATRGTESHVRMVQNAGLMPKTNVNLNMTNIFKQTTMARN